jgi:hypothetical protein
MSENPAPYFTPLFWGLLISVLVYGIYIINQQYKLLGEKRMKEVLSHKLEWGEEMCRWLINKGYYLDDLRIMTIMNNYPSWGQYVCQNVIEGKFGINYTVDMVRLALGEPSFIDEKKATLRDEKYRWIYGKPRHGALYIWFKNGRVTKWKE